MSHKILFQLCQAFPLGSNVLVGGHLFLDHEPIVAPNFSLLFFLQTLNFFSAFLITSQNTINTQLLHKGLVHFKGWIPHTISCGWSRQIQPSNTLRNIQIEHSRAGCWTFCINPSEITLCSPVYAAGVSSLKTPTVSIFLSTIQNYHKRWLQLFSSKIRKGKWGNMINYPD